MSNLSAPVSPEQDPDVQLMLAVQRGDGMAFRALFEKHVAGVVGFAMQFVGSRARAEELAQDVFLQVFRNRDRYVPRARFSTWLYRMVTNACVSEGRRAEHRTRSYSMDQPLQEGREEPPPVPDPSGRGPEDALLTREGLDRIRGALGTLPAQQRAALLLARVDGMSYEDVATSLSCSVSAVKSLIHRATVTLRDSLQENGV